MDLGMELYLYPETIVKVFVCITVIVAVVVFSKIITTETSKEKKKEVGNDDIRGDKKRVTKANVHKSR